MTYGTDFALKLFDFLVDFIQEKLQDEFDYDEKELIELFFEDGRKEPLSSVEFVEKYYEYVDDDCIAKLRNVLVAEASVTDDYIDFLAAFAEEDEEDQFRWSFVLSFLAVYKIMHDYGTKKEDETLTYFESSTMIDYKRNFIEDEEFGNELIQDFVDVIINEESFTEKINSIKEDTYANNISRKWEFNLYNKVTTVNKLLRDTLGELYAYYVQEGIRRIEILPLMHEYLIGKRDPIGRLEDYGFDDASVDYLKGLMIRIVISDLYEDALNYEYDVEKFLLGNTQESSEEINKMIISRKHAHFYLSLSLVHNLEDYVLRSPQLCNLLFYNYFDLLDDRERLLKNRSNTIRVGKEKNLAKLYPLYVLDDM